MSEFMVNFLSGNKNVQTDIYCDHTEGLKAAGVECVALVSLGGSFFLNEFIAKSSLPIVNILAPLRKHLAKTAV